MTRLLMLALFPDLASDGEFGYDIYGSFSFFPYFIRYYSDLIITSQIAMVQNIEVTNKHFNP
jgi:hypothetical protein